MQLVVFFFSSVDWSESSLAGVRLGILRGWPKACFGYCVSYFSQPGEEQFILVHGVREFSPWLPIYMHLRRTSWGQERVVEETSSRLG